MRTFLPLVLTFLLFAGVSYLLFTDTPTPSLESEAPPIEIIDDVPPLTIIEDAITGLDSAKRIQQDADLFVDTLSQPQNVPVIISSSQGEFVRHDSDIILLQEEKSPANLNTENKIESEPTNLRIQDIIQHADLNSGDMFYLHHVTEQDQQGLWGIIQHGLVEKFRAGLSLEGVSSSRDALHVVIPADADERLTSGLSSFLGKLLSKKVHSSYIYNLDTQSIGRNPDLIQPGQQLVLIKFSPEELKSVYQFFAERRQQAVQTYGIPN